MAIDPSIPLAAIGQQQRAVDPFQVAQSLQAMQINRQSSAVLNEQRQALADQRQRTLADQDSLDAAVTPGAGVEDILAKLPGHMHAAVRKQFAEADEANTKAKDARLKADAAESDYFGSLAASVKSYASQGPESMLNAAQLAIAHAKANGHDTTQFEGILKDNPQALPQVLDSLIAASPEQRKLATSDAAANKDRAALDGVVADSKVKQQVAAGTVNGLTPEQQAVDARSKATTAETAAYHRAELANQRHTQEREDKKFDATYGQGKDDNGQPVVSPMAKAIAEYRQPGFSGRSAATGLGKAMMEQVMALNPSYDASQFPSRNKLRIAFTSGDQSKKINALNTAIGHIDQLTDVADKLGNGSFVPGNAAWNAVRTAFGADAATNFDTLKDALAGEVDNVLSGGGGSTVSGREEAKKKIRDASSPQQLAGYVKTLIPVLGSKLSSYDYQYRQTMGDKDPYTALSPESRTILTKHGFDPAGHGGPAQQASGGGAVVVTDPRGIAHTFPTQAAADAFKKAAGIQ